MFRLTNQVSQNPLFTAFDIEKNKLNHVNGRLMVLNKAKSQILFRFDHPVNLIEDKGLALLVITDNPHDPSSFRKYILKGAVQIRPGNYFNILALSQTSQVLLLPQQKDHPQQIKLDFIFASNMDFEGQVHYFMPLSMTYEFIRENESLVNPFPNFWHLLILDHGQITLKHNQMNLSLNDSQYVFLPPNQDYNLLGVSKQSSYILLPFTSKIDYHFDSGKILTLNQVNKDLIQEIIDLLALSALDYLQKAKVFALFQLVFINLISNKNERQILNNTTKMKEKSDNKAFELMDTYIKQNLDKNIQVADLANLFKLSRSTLQQLFNTYVNMTPKQYINHLRLSESKRLIRESTLSLSEIALQLGFGSIQYFSRAFSREFGMSPSAYAKQKFQ
ncbi:helix-turn-helix domain-containing protein [Eremococcus coleocola]|uniref:helix-turn-helix domain-containing protein n=1 Tax=Eremococcus coleocola TaxID=88132 RepID=UPI0003F9EE8D|nr:AraC family transcriptional regulator [Eremococcus coleocola]